MFSEKFINKLGMVLIALIYGGMFICGVNFIGWKVVFGIIGATVLIMSYVALSIFLMTYKKK